MTNLLSEQALSCNPKKAPMAYLDIEPTKVNFMDDASSTGEPEDQIPLAI